MQLNIEQLKKFKGLPLDTKTAEAYAKLRLGLGDDWCAYAWSCDIDRNDISKAFDRVDAILDDDDEGLDFIRDAVDEARDELEVSDVLPDHQMLVYLVNAPTLKVAREIWDDELEVEYRVCIIDWLLVQKLLEGT